MSQQSSALILASASPARRRMLEAVGLEVETLPARIDEALIRDSMLAEKAPARDIADALAEMKARRVAGQLEGRLADGRNLFIIGADQILACEGRLYEKPADRDAAAAQLRALRGKSHELLSAAVILQNGAPVWRHIGVARLTMRPFSDEFLEDYLTQASDDILGCVGAYQIEGRGAQLFSRISGDYFSILGMPLLELLGFLRMRGVLIE